MSESAYLPRFLAVLVGVMGMAGQIHGESSGQLLDPTRPKGWHASEKAQPDTEAQPLTALELQGTYSLAGRRSAMINGQRVMVGDQVSGAEVIEINKNTVTLRIDGETVELASLLPDIKSPVHSKGDGK